MDKTDASSPESGQMLVLMTLMTVVLVGLTAMVVDVGFFLHQRAVVQHSTDAAALAGAQVLPDSVEAEQLALEYAEANGVDPNDLEVSFRCSSQATSVCDPASGLFDTIQVRGKIDVPMFLAPVLSVAGATDICWLDTCPAVASAAACNGLCGSPPAQPVDVVLVMDETGTMKSGCKGNEATDHPEMAWDCPIAQARLAAHTLLDNLFGDGGADDAHIGIVPFRGCYGEQRFNPVPGEKAGRGCILFDEVVGLTGPLGRSSLDSAIDDMHADGGFPGTNICSGLFQAQDVLFGANSRPDAAKVIVLVTDGDNRYSDGAQGGKPNRASPIPAVYPTGTWPAGQAGAHPCKPGTVPGDNSNYGPEYDDAVNEVDALTYAVAKDLENQGVETYVVRFANPAGDAADSVKCIPANVGSGSGRQGGNEESDRNLSRCLASSAPETNDHYFYAPKPKDLPPIFSEIAGTIARGSRLVPIAN